MATEQASPQTGTYQRCKVSTPRQLTRPTCSNACPFSSKLVGNRHPVRQVSLCRHVEVTGWLKIALHSASASGYNAVERIARGCDSCNGVVITRRPSNLIRSWAPSRRFASHVRDSGQIWRNRGDECGVIRRRSGAFTGKDTPCASHGPKTHCYKR